MKTSWPGAPHSQVSDLLKFQIQCLHFLYSGWKRNLSTLCNMLCSPKERAPGMTLRLTFPNSALGRPHLEFCGCSIQGRCQQTASSPAQGHQELLSMMRKGWEMGLFSMRKRRQGSVQREANYCCFQLQQDHGDRNRIFLKDTQWNGAGQWTPTKHLQIPGRY